MKPHAYQIKPDFAGTRMGQKPGIMALKSEIKVHLAEEESCPHLNYTTSKVFVNTVLLTFPEKSPQNRNQENLEDRFTPSSFVRLEECFVRFMVFTMKYYFLLFFPKPAVSFQSRQCRSPEGRVGENTAKIFFRHFRD